MGEFLLGCFLGFAFIACLAAPFVAPWRVRVRYLVNAQVADPVFGFAAPYDVTMREVTLSRIDADRGRVGLVVDEVGGRPESAHRSFTRAECTPAVVAKLDGWSATHTPLLLVVDEVGATHLYGPDGALTHLDRVEEKTS